MRIAELDDDQNVAISLAHRSRVTARAELTASPTTSAIPAT